MCSVSRQTDLSCKLICRAGYGPGTSCQSAWWGLEEGGPPVDCSRRIVFHCFGSKISSLPVSVSAAPAHGMAVVKVSKLRQSGLSAVARSKGILVLYYRSKADYTRDDTITYKVTSSSGKAREHVVHI